MPVVALPPQLTTRPADEQHGLRHSGRERVFPGKYSDFICYSPVTGPDVFQQSNEFVESRADEYEEPTSYIDAVTRPDRER